MASEYVIGFALLTASSSGHVISFATVYRQVETGSHGFSGLQTKINVEFPTVFLNDAILVSWKIFWRRKLCVKFCRRDAGGSSKEH